MRIYFSILLTMSLLSVATSNVIAQTTNPSTTQPDQVAATGSSSSHSHFNAQVKKLNGSGLVFAGAYSTALKDPNAPTGLSRLDWWDDTVSD